MLLTEFFLSPLSVSFSLSLPLSVYVCMTAQRFNAVSVADIDKRRAIRASKQRKHLARPHGPWIKPLFACK